MNTPRTAQPKKAPPLLGGLWRRLHGPRPWPGVMGLVQQNLPLLAFLTLIAAVYIANGHRFERLVRREATLHRALKELRTEHNHLQAELAQLKRYSRIRAAADSLGLVHPQQPPYVHYTDPDDLPTE